MKDYSTLDSKLKKYAALATGITAVAGTTNAQVVYTDINPDHLVSGNLDTYLFSPSVRTGILFSFLTSMEEVGVIFFESVVDSLISWLTSCWLT